ncbi:DUF202 domain-containing protein [Pseudactinotalea suaedae]|uniref:DUF202 domain-containing protein n=1 Tax=Pseudactinotalea suaedae TaxID=1524924 RepID=UPI0012E2ED1E|nr:DUF202 domain-containing protein [Pseudactinotalea suaedae]
MHSDLDADGGAQPQRTMLAWNRTLLAAVLGCATVAFAAQRQQMVVTAAVAACAAIAVLVLVLRDMPAWHEGGSAHYRLMRHVAGAVVLLAGLGVVIAVRGILG